MASIEQVAEVIHRIAEGIEEAVLDCISENRGLIISMIREQIYSGLDGGGRFLNPTYDNDPYFNEPGRWQGRAYQYKLWKRKITPPISSYILNLPPRPDNVPNLFITGTFFDSITGEMRGGVMTITTEGFIDGPDIVGKYGDGLLDIGYKAKEYLVGRALAPKIADFFHQCGY